MWGVELVYVGVSWAVAGPANSNKCTLVGAGPIKFVQSLSIGHPTMIHQRTACDACIYGDPGYSCGGRLRACLGADYSEALVKAQESLATYGRGRRHHQVQRLTRVANHFDDLLYQLKHSPWQPRLYLPLRSSTAHTWKTHPPTRSRRWLCESSIPSSCERLCSRFVNLPYHKLLYCMLTLTVGLGCHASLDSNLSWYEIKGWNPR
jgi:hypothetical protein